MIDKVDLVMWTKNGARTLPLVLKRIREVIPDEFVNKRVIVDDGSTDNTKEIAKSFGWAVIPNEGKGISDGANTALKHVESEYFISFEQDLLLAYDWWEKLPSHLEDPTVAIASGMRFASKPIGLKKLQLYVAKKYRGEPELSPWLKHRYEAFFTAGKNLDNTIYRTSVVRSLGGFPKLKTNAGVDTVLAYQVKSAGFQWTVDYSVKSIHLRHGLKDELQHQRSYGSQAPEVVSVLLSKIGDIQGDLLQSKKYALFTLAISPATGLFMAVRGIEPSIIFIHPLCRLYYFKGLLEAPKIHYFPSQERSKKDLGAR